MRQTKASRYLL